MSLPRVSTYSRRVPLRRMMMMDPKVRGRPGRRYVIRGGAVMTMDPNAAGARGQNSGGVRQADVLVEGKKIVAVGPNLGSVGGAK